MWIVWREGAPCLEPPISHGYSIDEAEVIFWGLCPHCQEATKEEKTSIQA